MTKPDRTTSVSLIFVFIVLLLPISARAVPKLIVAPTGTDATYYGDYDEYLDYWADSFLPETDAEHGFALPASGGYLSIAADAGDIGGYHIYLLVENGGVDYGITYNGVSLQPITDYDAITSTTQIDGYTNTPYWGIDVGPVYDANNNPNTGWTLITHPALNGGTYYEYSAPLLYDDTLPHGTYFFAIVDDNGSNRGTLTGDTLASNDTFSPKTSSSGEFTPNPEPATILLLGSGLAGLGVFRRKIGRRQG